MIISSSAYPLHLTYQEVAELDGFVARVLRKDLERVTSGASWSASAFGVTITFGKALDRNRVVDLVHEAISEANETWEKE